MAPRMSLCVAAALLLCATADTITWTGGAKDKLWDNPANWSPAKVPTAKDVAQLGEQAVVNVATPGGAGAYAVFMKDGTYLSIFGSNFTIGDGGLFTSGYAALRVDSGAGTFTVTGPAWINGTAAMWWQSGFLNANFIIGTTAQFNATGTAWLSCSGGAFNVLGTMSIIGGGIFNSSCPIVNWGRVIVSSPSPAQLTTLYEAHVFTSHGGTFTIEGANPVNINYLEANDASIAANVNWQPTGTGRLNGTTLTGLIHVQGQADVLLRNTTGSGGVKAENTVPLRFSESTDIGDVVLQAGQINIVDGTFKAGHISVNAGSTIDTAKESTTEVKQLDITQPLVIQGTGDLRVHAATISSLATIASSLTVLDMATVTAPSVLLNLGGSLNIAESATLLATCVQNGCAYPQVWSTQTVAPGTLNLNGNFRLNGSEYFTVIINGLKIPTPFNVSLESPLSKLNLQNMKAVIPSIHLGYNATFAGASLNVAYKSLTGPAVGDKIYVTYNSNYEECLSPCPGKDAPGSPYGVFQATTLVPDQAERKK
eukprot:TRINITY_DN9287_c0_g1_i1.p1 TRINITY_DN9287_c0_g1~~TRINITY_DN9287_c0_g1_i1.p1  ORF type:complete len:539 (-),score=108.55 TRINITY_DN9287_c0_g1_i1:194-1810(-)